MNKTATVKDGSLKAITTNKVLNVLTVKEFLKKECDCDPKKSENQEYIQVLQSQQLSNFFAKKFKADVLKSKQITNLSEISDDERERILSKVEVIYEKCFPEYRELFEIYVEKLMLLNAEDSIRNAILAEKRNNGYQLHTTDFVRPSEKVVIKKAPVKALIK